MLGLDVCSETIVGNDMLRGISGGQRKRVTTGEMAVGPRKTDPKNTVNIVMPDEKPKCYAR